MKTCYVVSLSALAGRTPRIAIADLVRPGELTRHWTITRINVPDGWRGRGLGSQLLGDVLRDADTERVVLELEPSPSGPLDYDALVEWYARKAFRVESSGYMVRFPQTIGE